MVHSSQSRAFIMAWKILSLLSVLCLAVAAYFANASKHDITNEMALEKRAKENLAEAKAQKIKGDEGLVAKNKQLVAVTEDINKVKTDVAAAETGVKEMEAGLELAKKNLEQITQQLAAMQAKIDEAGDIEKLLAQVSTLKKDKEAAELEVTNQTQALSAIAGKIAAIEADTARYRDLDARQRRGVMEPTFEARVAQYFGDWGFVVLSKGNAGGVVANAELNVTRGKDVVAKLKVKNVENNTSVADVIPGSLAEGDSLRSGDMVVPAPEAAKPMPTEKKDAPVEPKPDGTTATPHPPVDTMAQPQSQPAGGDPFGSPAPAPAPAAGADPFGSPAPATPPAGAEAGTKENPSTADPFK